MPLQLLSSEAAALAALDTQLDTGFATGAEFPPATVILPKLDGYSKPMIVAEIDQSAIYKPKIRNPFSMVIAAMMKAVQSWQVPGFLNSWQNYDTTTFTAAGYYRDFMGRCYLRGLVRSGTVGQPIFNLPAGYRPTKVHIFNAVSNDLFGQVRVFPNGDVTCTVGTNAWVSLDQIDFRAEQ